MRCDNPLPNDQWSLYTGSKWSLGPKIVVVNCNLQVVGLGKLIGLLTTCYNFWDLAGVVYFYRWSFYTSGRLDKFYSTCIHYWLRHQIFIINNTGVYVCKKW